MQHDNMHFDMRFIYYISLFIYEQYEQYEQIVKNKGNYSVHSAVHTVHTCARRR